MGVDTVTQGPPTAAECFGTEGTILDAANNVLYTFGTSRTPAAVMSSQLTLGIQTALTAITTAQNLFTQVLGPGYLNLVGRTLKVTGSLIYSTTAANAAAISIAVKLGAVTLGTITTAATNTAASTNLPINFTFTVSVASIGASGTLVTVGEMNADIGTTAASAVATYLDTTTTASSAADLLTTQTLAVTIAASAAVPSATLLNASVQLLS